ncbi:MAG: quaternary ammonium compound-resistance protein SugE [Planctomycetota bacterium]|jgi:quaternary ammonium compound-resistance protein SugE
MAWLTLLIAGLFESCWAVGLVYTKGFTKLWPTVFVVITLAISMWLLAVASRTIPIGTAYAVWVGIGACSTAIYGIWRFSEDASPARIVFLALLIVAIIGLKVTAD